MDSGRDSSLPNGVVLLASMAGLTMLIVVASLIHSFFQTMRLSSGLLTDPFLQRPTDSSIKVVWFTEFPGSRHWVEYGDNLAQSVTATTTQLSRTREDQKSYVGQQGGDGTLYAQPTYRPVWRHEATVTDLLPDQRLPYRVVSVDEAGRSHPSQPFSLRAMPPKGAPLNILLTSDHQLMPLTPANLQMVQSTVGTIDAIFLAGDLVNIPDRASEWFDDNRGRAFFPSLQGRAKATVEVDGRSTTYQGGALIQSAPLFPTIGNHEVMGRWSMEQDLGYQFNDPVPVAIATQRYQTAVESGTIHVSANIDPSTWITNQSFNTITYHEIFSLPQNSQGHSKYYAVTVGDVRLVVLYATNIWRVPSLAPNARGRYREADADLNDSTQWGYGQHIFEPIAPGSEQYAWLQQELQSPEFAAAQYKIVMLHHPPHTLGDNIVPAYTNPVQIIDRFEDGRIKAVRYEYPKTADYLIRDVVPLLEHAGVDLVFFGHSHLWNRFTSPQGTHFLESSNVGNSYGAFLPKTVGGNQEGDRRPIPIGYGADYAPWGDPNGLSPVMPTIAPLVDERGDRLPYIASNDITVFSIFNTATGTVSSYRFDVRTPEEPVVKFDEFSLD
ncbi:MAG: metallophosphoesterase family protein [Leptolyngbyaceae bacterium]|nr:metallophosphoesterase family protein [Leptolyngbyaceae bacterium]